MKEFNCTLFDGEKLTLNTVVLIDNGKIISIEKKNQTIESNYFLMPCLIDAHTHVTNIEQVNIMKSYGISHTFDVCASLSFIESIKDFNIISSIDMAMGIVLNPKKFVENAISNGAKYIKVLLFNPLSIGTSALKGIVKEAHKNNLKVVVHATEMATYKQAVDCDVDIILHLPMKDKMTDEFARLIASKNIYVVPTLVMMETFANSGKNGYNQHHFENALNQVQTLYKNGVNILVGTDANIGSFAPKVDFGYSIYHEIDLLQKAGLPLIEVLKGATSKIGKAFDMDLGINNNLLLFEIQNNNININYEHLKSIWINGDKIK